MAIYTNLKLVDSKTHGIFERSSIKSSIVGRIYDLLVKDDADKEIDVDNGVLLKVGEFTKNGLQEREATIAKDGDKVAISGSPAVVKDAFTFEQSQVYNYYNKAGKPLKAYELVPEDIFVIDSYQVTSGDVKVDSYVTVDGNVVYVATDVKPADTYGFIGRIHSISTGTYYKIVRVEVIKNEQVA